MYAKSLYLENFKCFGKAGLKFQHPGRRNSAAEFKNVNLVLGDNGGGKSSVLRAIAITMLAPVLRDSGFVPYRLVRRVTDSSADVKRAVLRVEALSDQSETEFALGEKRFTLQARILLREHGGDLDRLAMWQMPTGIERLYLTMLARMHLLLAMAPPAAWKSATIPKAAPAVRAACAMPASQVCSKTMWRCVPSRSGPNA